MLNVSVPLNNLSFGHVGINILRELYNRGDSVNLFSVGGVVDLKGYDIPEDFGFWIHSCIGRAKKLYKNTDPTFKLWHIDGAQESISSRQGLMTFHEVDSLTAEEINILRNQHKVFVSSKFSEEVFTKAGLTNVVYCPLGFDAAHFHKVPKEPRDKVTFALFGKFEKRKHTEKVIKAWLSRYKNDPGYELNLHVYNPFFTPEQNNQILLNIFGGTRPWNVNPIGYVDTLVQFNNAINYADIVLDMSGGESWSIPSFTAVALGKHAVLHNCNAIKDWAEDSGAVLIEPNGKELVYDGVFFKQGMDRNQGSIFTFDESEFLAGCEQTVQSFKKNPLNEKGLALQEKFTWARTVNIIKDNL